MKNIANIHNPALNGFDDLFSIIGEERELTPQQKSDYFLTRWMQTMEPFKTYPKRIKSEEDKNTAILLKFVGVFFKDFVINEQWSEKKYVMVIDSILTTNIDLNRKNLYAQGKLYDEEKLESQLIEKRRNKRRKRI